MRKLGLALRPGEGGGEIWGGGGLMDARKVAVGMFKKKTPKKGQRILAIWWRRVVWLREGARCDLAKIRSNKKGERSLGTRLCPAEKKNGKSADFQCTAGKN